MPTRLYVFGSNSEGQLGIPAKDIVSTPTIAKSWPSNEKIKNICSGDNHTLFLTDSGAVWGVGDNQRGQLGLSTNLNETKFEELKKLQDDVSFCAATCESSAYITNFETSIPFAQSTLITEGTGHWGELGLGPSDDNTSSFSRQAVQQSLPCPAIDFGAGAWHYVAILHDGTVYGWGKSRLDQLGPKLSSQQHIGTPTRIEDASVMMPIKVVCGKDFTHLASHPTYGYHIIFGRDKFGLRSNMPSHIKDWKDIGATWHAIFVLFQDGSLTAWGKDNMWNLVPAGLPKIDKMAVGSEHILALTREGRLISWGWGKHGNCGDLTKLKNEGKVKNDMVSNYWNEIPISGKIRAIGAGFCTSFALTEIEDKAAQEE